MFFERVGRLFIGRFPELFGNPEIIHGFSTRKGGVSPPPFNTLNCGTNTSDIKRSIGKNRLRFLQSFNISSDDLAIPQQVHENKIVNVKEPVFFEATDGLITNIPGIVLSIQVADCVPIYLYDPTKKVIGLVHAGWQGSAQKIVQKAVSEMQNHFNSKTSDILSFIGPSIGPCCYEVSHEVLAQFPDSCVNKNHLDLWKANVLQLEMSGLDSNKIFVSGICTKCHANLFFSHRASGGKTGRMLAVFGFRNKK